MAAILLGRPLDLHFTQVAVMTGPGIAPELLAAFLRGELTDQEAEEISQAIDGDHSVQELTRSLFRPDVDIRVLLQDVLPRAAVAHEPELQSTLNTLRELGTTLVVQRRSVQAPLPKETQGGDCHQQQSRIGDYEILGLLGSGGMGTVYRARHRYLQREFAVKVVASHRQENAQALARFQREVAINGRLKHQHLVHSVSAGEHEARPYLVMELLPGKDIGRIAEERGCLAMAEACEIVRQAADGVAYLAISGLVHRDLKPSNLMLVASDESSSEPTAIVKILDLGLASEPGGDDQATVVTHSNQVLGTFDYVAPEQALDARRVDTRADIYSLGCTLYRLLSGHAPFDRPGMNSPVAKLVAHHWRRPESLKKLRPDIPIALCAIVERAMAKKPARRFATAQQLATALAPYCGDAKLTKLLQEPAVGDFRAPAAFSQSSGICRTGNGVRRETRLSLIGFSVAMLLGGFVISIRTRDQSVVITSTSEASQIEIRLNGPELSKPSSVTGQQVPAMSQVIAAESLGIPVELTNSLGMKFRIIPPHEEVPVAKKQDQVTRQSFYLGTYEVSLAEFQRVMNRTPQAFSGKQADPSLPAQHVSWAEAIDFCRLLSDLPEERKAERQYSLPTQAEWEWACRGGNTEDLPWPANENRNRAVFLEPAPLPSGAYPPNQLGLYDLHGNVAEWAADWSVDPRPASKSRLPSGSLVKTGALCGGSYDSVRPEQLAVSARIHLSSDAVPRADFGFRVLCTQKKQRQTSEDAALPDALEVGFDPLLPRDQTLRGWGYPGGSVANHYGELEQAAGAGDGGGSIWYGYHGNLNDFDLRFDFKIDQPDLETQLFLRANFLEQSWEKGSGYRLFLAGPKAGLLYQEEPGHLEVVEAFSADALSRTRLGIWNPLVIRCEGNRTRIWLNSLLALDFRNPGTGVCARGPLSFLTSGSKAGPRRSARFRNLRIKLLGEPDPADLKYLPWTMGGPSLPPITPPQRPVP